MAPTPRTPPDLLLNPPNGWRDTCQSRFARLPAGYTYFAQLLGHDMGQSVPLNAVPRLVEWGLQPGAGQQSPTRYNLIENPLTLETIYGPGPTMLGHLYDPDSFLFRIAPGQRLADCYWITSHPNAKGGNLMLRGLYDERNRDTLMLHELAVLWMQFHNLCARQLGGRGFDTYAKVRGHAVAVWHQLIRADLLPRFAHSAGLAVAPVDETTLQHGLFRTFHSMPLDVYPLTGAGPEARLIDILKHGYGETEAERLGWSVDWALFLGDDGPKAGISLSQAQTLGSPGLRLAHRDLATAGQTGPARPTQAGMAKAISDLPPPWASDLQPEALARAFNARFGPDGAGLAADDLRNGPLYQYLAVEAMVHATTGGFGPFGAGLLRASVEASINRVQGAQMYPGLPAPPTLLDLVKLVRKDM